MKKIHLLSLGWLFISNIVFAAPPVTLDDVNNQLDLVANGPEYSPPQTEREQLWKDFNAVPVSGSGDKVDWDNMPPGSRCGNYVMSGGVTRSQTLCQGHNPRYSCPSGFSREDFGYFEAGGGPRQYNWCSKL